MGEKPSFTPEEELSKLDLSKGKEWVKSISDEEYFDMFESREQDPKTKKKDSEAMFEPSKKTVEIELEKLSSMNEYFRFLKKLETKEGSEFVKSIGPKRTAEIRKIAIKNIIELIKDGFIDKPIDKNKYQYSRDQGTFGKKNYFDQDEKRERISLQSVEDITGFIKDSTVLSLDEKSDIISETVSQVPFYLIEMPRYTDKAGLKKGLEDEDEYKLEAKIYKRIREGLNDEKLVENVAQKFIESLPKEVTATSLLPIPKIAELYLFNFIASTKVFQDFLVENVEAIKTKTISQFDEMLSKETDSNKMIEYRAKVHTSLTYLKRALDNFSQVSDESRVKTEIGASTEEINEDIDRKLLKKSQYFAKTIFSESYVSNVDNHLDVYQVTSEKLKGEIQTFAECINKISKKSENVQGLNSYLPPTFFNYENFEKLFSAENPQELMKNFSESEEVWDVIKKVNQLLQGSGDQFLEFDYIFDDINILKQKGFDKMFWHQARYNWSSYNSDQIVKTIDGFADGLSLDPGVVKKSTEKVLTQLLSEGELAQFKTVFNGIEKLSATGFGKLSVEKDFTKSKEMQKAYMSGFRESLSKGYVFSVSKFMKSRELFGLSGDVFKQKEFTEAYVNCLNMRIRDIGSYMYHSNAGNLTADLYELSWYLSLSDKFGVSKESFGNLGAEIKESAFIKGFIDKQFEENVGLDEIMKIMSENSQFFDILGADTKKFFENFKDYEKFNDVITYGGPSMKARIFRLISLSPDAEGKIEVLFRLNDQIKELLAPQSPLHNYADKIIEDIINSSNPEETINKYTSIFMNGLSKFYQKCIQVVRTNLGNELAIGQSSADVRPAILEVFGGEKDYPDTTFSSLELEEKIKILENILKRAEALSQNYKYIADGRNREWIKTFYQKSTVDKGIRVNILNEVGTMIHGASVGDLSAILTNGNIARECILQKSSLDAAPFHVDFSEVTSEAQKYEQTESIKSLGGTSYGDGLILVYQTEREQTGDYDSKELAKDEISDQSYVYDLGNWPEKFSRPDLGVVPGGRHSGVLGAIPSIEISGIIINEVMVGQRELDYNQYIVDTEMKIVENGFYIPVFDAQGHLLFSPEEFEQEIKKYKIYEKIEDAVNDPDFYEKVLSEKYNPDFSKLLASLPTMEGQGGVHKFTRQRHMEITLTNIDKINEQGYGIRGKQLSLVKLAARLHDIGKAEGSVQFLDNTTVAQEIIKKSIKDITESDVRLVLLLIREDELLGKLLEGTGWDEAGKLTIKEPGLKEKFLKLFMSNDPDFSDDENKKRTDEYRKMMICLYKADIMAIDGGELYEGAWAIDEKLKALELDYV